VHITGIESRKRPRTAHPARLRTNLVKRSDCFQFCCGKLNDGGEVLRFGCPDRPSFIGVLHYPETRASPTIPRVHQVILRPWYCETHESSVKTEEGPGETRGGEVGAVSIANRTDVDRDGVVFRGKQAFQQRFH
jgi:hypothetical protein